MHILLQITELSVAVAKRSILSPSQEDFYMMQQVNRNTLFDLCMITELVSS